MSDKSEQFSVYKVQKGERPTRRVVSAWLIVLGSLLVIGGLVNFGGSTDPSWGWYVALLAGIAALVTGLVLVTRRA